MIEVAIHTDSIAASIEADEEACGFRELRERSWAGRALHWEAQRFLEPGFGAPAPKHPMDRPVTESWQMVFTT